MLLLCVLQVRCLKPACHACWSQARAGSAINIAGFRPSRWSGRCRSLVASVSAGRAIFCSSDHSLSLRQPVPCRCPVEKFTALGFTRGVSPKSCRPLCRCGRMVDFKIVFRHGHTHARTRTHAQTHAHTEGRKFDANHVDHTGEGIGELLRAAWGPMLRRFRLGRCVWSPIFRRCV